MKIKPFLKLILSIVTDIKIYISRTISWISMANSLMLVFLVIERLSSMGIIKKDLTSSFVIVVGVWFCILVVLGWVEVNKVRAPHVEAEKMLKLNPPAQRAYIKIDKIYEKMVKMEEKLKINDGQQKQVKQVRREDDYFSESEASPDNVGVDDNLEGKK